jgi:hypothetical protein
LTIALCAVVFAIGASAAAAASCAVPSGYATINAALADTSCDPIIVAAGNYDEQLDITRSVTITGAGSASTTIAPQSKPNELVGIRNGATVELSGFTIRYPLGFYVAGYPSVQNIGVHVYEGASANVHDNVITQIHNDVINGNQTGHCVMVGNNSPASAATLNLHDNTITYCQKQGISVRANSTVTITSNEVAYGNQGDSKDPLDPNIYANNGIVLSSGVTGVIDANNVHDWICTPGAGSGPPCGPDPLNDTQSIGILPFGTQAALTISNNSVHDNDSGLFAYSNGTTPVNITNNTFSDNIGANISVYASNAVLQGNTSSGSQYGLMMFGNPAPAPTDVQLSGGNTITGATVQGAYTDASPTNIVNISGSGNSFDSNGAGIDVSGATTANLTCNWWGSVTGPTIGSNPGGSGDATSANAVYSPWAYNHTTFECGPANPEPSLAFGAASITSGTSTTLSLTLSNTDGAPISEVAGGFVLPAGIHASSIVSNSCGGVVLLGGGANPTFSGSVVPAAGSCVIVFIVTADAAGSYSATVPVGTVTSPRGNSLTAASAALNVAQATVPPIQQVDPIPACLARQLLITDVSQSGRRARVSGYARLKYVGQKAAIRMQMSGSKILGYATIRADGSFTTLVNAPPHRLRYSGRARYQAAIGGGKTLWIKLTRRMNSTLATFSAGKIVVNGSVKTPVVAPAKLAVTVSYQCSGYKTIGYVRVNRRTGRFSGAVATRTDIPVSLVRLRVKVRRSNVGKNVFSTYSIVQPLVLK